MRAMLLAPSNRNGPRMRVDAVLDKFSDRFERIALRERNDPNRIPVVTNAQLAAVLALYFHFGSAPGLDGSSRVRLPSRISCHAPLNSAAWSSVVTSKVI